MANPFRTNNKTLIIILGGILVFAFLLPTTGLDHLFNNSNPVVGTVNGKKLRAQELAVAENKLRALSSLFVSRMVADPRTGRPREYQQSLGEVVLFEQRDPNSQLTPQVQKLLKDFFGSDPLHFELLVREARAAGIVVGASQVNDLLANPSLRINTTSGGREISVSPMDSAVSEPQRNALRSAVSDLLAIQQLRDLQTRFAKSSSPLVDHSLAKLAQTFKLDVVEFKVQSASDQPAPTEAQLQEQFKAYADVTPGRLDNSNPFGFGYRLPDRLKLQYLAVPLEPIREVVRKTKSDADWAVEAYVFYEKNPDLFREAPSTQPATQPQDSALSSAPGVVKPFDAVKADATKEVIEQEVIKSATKIVDRIRASMRADYDRVESARATKQPVPLSRFGSAIDSADYVQKLAGEIQQQFNVLPETFASDRLLSFDELATLENISQTQIPFAVFPNLKQLLDESEFGSRGENLLSLLQPTVALIDATQARLYVARVVEVSKSMPATDMADIKDRVTADLMRKALVEKTSAEAREYLAKAGDGSFPNDPARVPFRTSTIGLNEPLTTPALADREAAQFVAGTISAFATGNATTGVIEVPSADRVYAAKLVSRELTLPSLELVGPTKSQIRVRLDSRLWVGIDPNTDQPLFEPLALTWMDPKSIETRNGYVSARGESMQGESARQ